ncbi:hypothetical protein [Nocardioides sp.]|uniref:hypothetical protein n=1 Tax=Nocardioides sp. TaxID=35761 RepID=UPI003517872A
MRPPAGYVRFQATWPDRCGSHIGVFGLTNMLGRSGRLTPEQERFRVEHNAWYDAAYPDPSTVDPTVYDHTVNPGAVAWFRSTATHLIARVDGYLEILASHGVACVRVESDDPGRIVYADDVQAVVVPHHPSRP